MHNSRSLAILSALSLALVCLPACKSNKPENPPMGDTLTQQSDTAPRTDTSARMDTGMRRNTGAASASGYPMVGGAEMSPTKNIIDNASNSKDHTTLVAAINAAGLGGTLKGAGPYTVFAPTNEAFSKLKSGTLDSLLKPANKTHLKQILTYHVIAGKLDSAELVARMQAGNGVARLKTVNGTMLSATMDGNQIALKDEAGGVVHVTTPNVYQSNGVIHVIDGVLMPQ